MKFRRRVDKSNRHIKVGFLSIDQKRSQKCWHKAPIKPSRRSGHSKPGDTRQPVDLSRIRNRGDLGSRREFSNHGTSGSPGISGSTNTLSGPGLSAAQAFLALMALHEALPDEHHFERRNPDR